MNRIALIGPGPYTYLLAMELLKYKDNYPIKIILIDKGIFNTLGNFKGIHNPLGLAFYPSDTAVDNMNFKEFFNWCLSRNIELLNNATISTQTFQAFLHYKFNLMLSFFGSFIEIINKEAESLLLNNDHNVDVFLKGGKKIESNFVLIESRFFKSLNLASESTFFADEDLLKRLVTFDVSSKNSFVNIYGEVENAAAAMVELLEKEEPALT